MLAGACQQVCNGRVPCVLGQLLVAGKRLFQRARHPCNAPAGPAQQCTRHLPAYRHITVHQSRAALHHASILSLTLCTSLQLHIKIVRAHVWRHACGLSIVPHCITTNNAGISGVQACLPGDGWPAEAGAHSKQAGPTYLERQLTHSPGRTVAKKCSRARHI